MKLVYGIGVNDADYAVYEYKTTEGYKTIVWRCPFYLKWTDMLKRCYSKLVQNNQPTYKGCSVTPEWHSFMAFKAWMVEQDWQGKQLDKDLLILGNKVYSPEACIFVEKYVNTFLTERTNDRGPWPIGVSFDKNAGKYKAQGMSLETKKRKSLGYYNTPEEAHQAWLTEKLRQAKILASKQTNPRVAEALVKRYENYGN